ncbi:GrpB family protein [Arthrobacter sp. ATA002]|uniref:GrpB family protein n=1 Tax=Arthrobacter sp. ATA002 TaxID=2991715 RepID=UPI0022A6B69D|nr:GrpB family protein [Arthrobacter sp. ATA002]WAP50451.1 GrpB family protein [Arthrobacter sp. ATA002]
MNRAQDIALVAYDVSWPDRFLKTKDQLREVFPTESIDHIGSTSVPGLSSKDTIDVLVGVPDVGQALTSTILDRLTVLGFEYVPASFDDDDDHAFLHRIIGEHRSDHVHVMQLGSDALQGRLLFRDYLRATPTARAKYEWAKKDLAVRFAEHRDDYVKRKQPIVEALMEQARAWEGSH